MMLDAQQLAIIRRFAEVIVPSDETPGATSVPIAEMIATIASSWPRERQAEFALGLRATEDIALALFGVPVVELPPSLFAELVAKVVTSSSWAAFWNGLRTLVCLNFFALPPGYLPLGLPGPNVDRGGLPV